MKVDGNPEIVGNEHAVRKNSTLQPDRAGFNTIFKESLGNISGPGENGSRACHVAGISKSRLNLYNNVEAPLTQQVENYLNLLSEYREKLGNAEITLKELSPLVNQMNQEKARLSSTLENLPEGDGLKDILNETLVLSSLETIRFNRGDYNPH